MSTSFYFNHNTTPVPTLLQERAVKEAYLELYTLAGAKKEDHFIFTSSGAEAVNHAVFAAYVDVTRRKGKNHFLCSVLDEAPVIMSMERLDEMGCVFQTVPACEAGYVTEQAVAEIITPRTAMLSLSCANGLTGVCQPFSEIAALCHDRGILFHLDITHLLGKCDFSFNESEADLVSFNGPHAGMGGLFIGSDCVLSPFILGGKEQGNMRGGAFHIPSLLECAKWAKKERSLIDHYCMEIARLRSLFETRIVQEVPNTYVLFKEQQRVPHITSFVFGGVESDALCYALTQRGVFTTFGGNHFQHFAHILKASSISAPECYSALSFSFSADLSEEEIQEAASIIVETTKQLQKYSYHLMDKSDEL